jgi:serine/threonine protein kinase
MNDVKSDNSDNVVFTTEFLARYEPLECFSRNEISETYLVKLRENGTHYVVKIYDKYFVTDSADERKILENLNHPAIPKLTDSFETEESVYVIREYAKGKPLDESEEPVSERAALNIGTQLCDILTYLHTQTPPVIHRDIKPSNVIIDENGKLCLIDFGIARLYKETALKDTKYAATDGFSSPEQYGYMQTDAISDIYSLGKLLCWILTGSDDIIEIDSIKNRNLTKVIKKCAAFAPENRYKSAESVKTALHRAVNKGRYYKTAALSAALLLLMAGSFILGRITASDSLPPQGLTPPASDWINTDIYTFNEPLVEQAVKLMLDKDYTEPVTYGELDLITELHIFGIHPVMPGEYIEDPPNGSIFSLEDFTYMKSLRMLTLSNQPISDISLLSECFLLSELSIRHCPISDLSPLASLDNLRKLHIHATHVTDYSPIEQINALSVLIIGFETGFSRISDLGNISNLTDLSLYSFPLMSLEGVESMPLLRQLSIHNTYVSDFSHLNNTTALPDFFRLVISPDMEQFLYTLARNDIDVVIID